MVVYADICQKRAVVGLKVEKRILHFFVILEKEYLCNVIKIWQCIVSTHGVPSAIRYYYIGISPMQLLQRHTTQILQF